MAKIRYMGWEIEAVPKLLVDIGEWTGEIVIMKGRGPETKIEEHHAERSFRTKAEAIQHCFNYGRQIIEGKVQD